MTTSSSNPCCVSPANMLRFSVSLCQRRCCIGFPGFFDLIFFVVRFTARFAIPLHRLCLLRPIHRQGHNADPIHAVVAAALFLIATQTSYCQSNPLDVSDAHKEYCKDGEDSDGACYYNEISPKDSIFVCSGGRAEAKFCPKSGTQNEGRIPKIYKTGFLKSISLPSDSPPAFSAVHTTKVATTKNRNTERRSHPQYKTSSKFFAPEVFR